MKKSRSASRNENVSKLSNLPEDVLNKILCFLSQKEFVRTCVLSKSWRHRGITSLTKLELSLSSDFKGNKKSLSSALQRYKDQNLETLCINNSKKCNFHTHKPFPRLVSVCLEHLELSAESFGFFTSNHMPRLEKLQLHRCSGVEESRLSSPSMKHVSILHLEGLMKASFDAPNIERFELVAEGSVPLISFAPISSVWESYINLSGCYVSTWIVAVKKLLEALNNEGCIKDVWNVLKDEIVREDCFWKKDLVSGSVEFYGGGNANECLPFLGNSLSQCALLDKNKSRRVELKWSL